MAVDTGVTHRSPVLPILFAIYLNGVFKQVENEVQERAVTSFADDCG